MSEPSEAGGGGGYFANHDQGIDSNEASRVVGVRGWRRSRAAGGGWRARARKQYGAVHGWPRAREARPGGMGDDGWMGGRRARARADKYYKIFKEGVHTTR